MPITTRYELSSIGSERATSGSGNKIITADGKSHLVWQDSTPEGYVNRVRTFDHATKSFTPTVTLNPAYDNHARPVMTLDHDGYLHVILSGHNTEVTYRRSEKPGDTSSWTPEERIGDGTYPTVLCGADNTLYMTMRSCKGKRGVDFYRRHPGEAWQFIGELIFLAEEYPGYSGYQIGMGFGTDETLHLSVDFYESVHTFENRGTHQALCHLQTSDGGESFTKADGTPIELPARPEALDIIARDIGPRHESLCPPVLVSSSSFVVTPDGRPHTLYVSHLKKAGELLLATFDEAGVCQQQEITAMLDLWPEMRPAAVRAGLTCDKAGTLTSLVELYPLGEGWTDGKPLRTMRNGSAPITRLVRLTSTDNGKTFRAEELLAPGESCHQPNLERPTGVNAIPANRAPYFIYFEGNPDYPEEDTIIQNPVYFVTG